MSESEIIGVYGIKENGSLLVYDKNIGRVDKTTHPGYIKFIKNDETTSEIKTFDINIGPVCVYKEEDGDISEEHSLPHPNVIYIKKSKGGRKTKKGRKGKKGKKMSRRF